MCRAAWWPRGAGPSGWGCGGAQGLLLEGAVLELVLKDGKVVVSAQEGGRERREEGHSQKNRSRCGVQRHLRAGHFQ